MKTASPQRRLGSLQRIVLRSSITFILALAMFLALERNTSLGTIVLEALGFTMVIGVFDRFVFDRDESPEDGGETTQE
jgi:hypothetical protein